MTKEKIGYEEKETLRFGREDVVIIKPFFRSTKFYQKPELEPEPKARE